VACDAETDDDLRTLAVAAARLPAPVLLAGSAGLMRHVPAAFGLAKTAASARTESLSVSGTAARRAPLLFVVGSRSSVAREQLRLLAAEKGVRTFELAPAVLLGGAESDAWREHARLLEAAGRANADLAVAIGLGTQVDLRESGPLSRALGDFLQPLLGRVGGIFCTGGDTARALLGAAGAAGIRLAGEVEPGVACGTVEGARPVPVVLKPGAFGSPQALVRSRAVLHRLAVAQASPGP
jgi:4-hydroxythreonine-4-phosphate dehydrogenase